MHHQAMGCTRSFMMCQTYCYLWLLLFTIVVREFRSYIRTFVKYKLADCISARILWALYKRRKRNKSIFDSGVSYGIYYRMMVLGCVDAFLTLPASIFMFVSDQTPLPISFYPGWEVVHSNISSIPTVTAIEWKNDYWAATNVRWNLWYNPVTAIPFFALFGLTSEARAIYRTTFWNILFLFGIKWVDKEVKETRFGSSDGQNTAVNGGPK